MASVACSQVSHELNQGSRAILRKRVAIPRVGIGAVIWPSGLLHKKFPEQILPLSCRKDLFLHEGHDQVAQNHIVQR
jgi:hypothetical protein